MSELMHVTKRIILDQVEVVKQSFLEISNATERLEKLTMMIDERYKPPLRPILFAFIKQNINTFGELLTLTPSPQVLKWLKHFQKPQHQHLLITQTHHLPSSNTGTTTVSTTINPHS